MKEKNKTVTFEDAIIRLEEIVKLLETGDAKLEQSLALFEEGVKLTGYCNELLDGAEQKVMMLVKNDEGGMDEIPMPKSGETV